MVGWWGGYDTGSLDIQRPCVKLFITSECAEIPHHPVSNICYFDQAGIVGFCYERTVWHRQTSHSNINNIATNLYGGKLYPEHPIA